MIRETYNEQQLLNQGHMEIQLNAYQKSYQNKINKLNQLGLLKSERLDELEELRKQLNDKEQTVLSIQQHIDRMEQMIVESKNKLSYEQEYKQRQSYYRSRSVEGMSALALSSYHSLPLNSYKGVVISPDGIPFQHNRIEALLQTLSDEGYLCFKYNPGIEADIEPTESGFYLFKSEIQMLNWLDNIEMTPIVLCTWILQTAWFDELPRKKIWYDLCEEEAIVWDIDAHSRLKHYSLVHEADCVTYVNKRWNKYVALRRDAKLIPLELDDDCVEWVIGQWRGDKGN